MYGSRREPTASECLRFGLAAADASLTRVCFFHSATRKLLTSNGPNSDAEARRGEGQFLAISRRWAMCDTAQCGPGPTPQHSSCWAVSVCNPRNPHRRADHLSATDSLDRRAARQDSGSGNRGRISADASYLAERRRVVPYAPGGAGPSEGANGVHERRSSQMFSTAETASRNLATRIPRSVPHRAIACSGLARVRRRVSPFHRDPAALSHCVARVRAGSSAGRGALSIGC
jgi:hypothetical protein